MTKISELINGIKNEANNPAQQVLLNTNVALKFFDTTLAMGYTYASMQFGLVLVNEEGMRNELDLSRKITVTDGEMAITLEESYDRLQSLKGVEIITSLSDALLSETYKRISAVLRGERRSLRESQEDVPEFDFIPAGRWVNANAEVMGEAFGTHHPEVLPWVLEIVAGFAFEYIRIQTPLVITHYTPDEFIAEFVASASKLAWAEPTLTLPTVYNRTMIKMVLAGIDNAEELWNVRNAIDNGSEKIDRESRNLGVIYHALNNF